jgi:aminopeptidase YwaD
MSEVDGLAYALFTYAIDLVDNRVARKLSPIYPNFSLLFEGAFRRRVLRNWPVAFGLGTSLLHKPILREKHIRQPSYNALGGRGRASETLAVRRGRAAFEAQDKKARRPQERGNGCECQAEGRMKRKIVVVGGGGRRRSRLEAGATTWCGPALGKFAMVAAIASGLLASGARAQKPPLLAEKDVAALANELSGETAKRNLEVIATYHRQRGSKGFHTAAELVAARLREYGLSDVEILEFPADGKIFYGTQRSRPAWDAEVGELGELFPNEECKRAQKKYAEEHAGQSSGYACGLAGVEERSIASYEAEPVVLAEDSESANALGDLVDVGEGTKESDYAGKNVKDKIVLVGASPGTAQELAIGKFGARGIISYAQNQKNAWWGEDENLIRWGHLETFSEHKTFAFMVSLKTARGFRERLARGEGITLHAVVKAGQHPGTYEVVTATILGADPKLKEEEIAFSCHLDHQRPGANDNASGCVTILEVARTLNKLIGEGKLARPARTLRFIWPPEIEGTLALLNGKPEFAKRIKAAIHMDMVGGGPATKAVFHVTRGPMSLPSFVHDVAWAFAEWVNEESYRYAAGLRADYPMVAPEGGKEPLMAQYSAYTMGSDHDVYQDSSFGIPAIYMNDWPDRYIHTNFDTAANIDPTKLKRAGFIGAASGYFLATLTNKDYRDVLSVMMQGLSERVMVFERRLREVPDENRETVHRVFAQYDGKLSQSINEFAGRPNGAHVVPNDAQNGSPVKASGDGALVFSRKTEPKGPLTVFGYDYFEDHAKAAGVAEPKLLSYEGLWGGGEEYAYEVLNFADGKRNAQEIRDAVSAEYGPVPLEMVVEWLRALEKVGVVREVK